MSNNLGETLKSLESLLGEKMKRRTKPTVVKTILVDLQAIMSSKSGHHFIKGPKDLLVREGIGKVLWYWKLEDYVICAISNIAHLSYGQQTVQGWSAITTALTDDALTDNPFHLVYLNPFHVGNAAPYNCRSMFEYPNAGFLGSIEHHFMTDHDQMVDWDGSIIVGNNDLVGGMANNAGVRYCDIEEFVKLPVK